MVNLPDLSRTRDAIVAYDEADARFDTDHILSLSLIACHIAMQELGTLAEAVGAAYGEDTKDRNDPATCCQLVRPGRVVPGPGFEESFVRRMVREWEESC